MSQDDTDFENRFQVLTGNSPLSWQTRLFADFVNGAESLPNVIDLPTGLGKTMVMAIWLIARKQHSKLPRRLIYVVDRRTVVDQATDLAKKLQGNVGEEHLAISTLRGLLADNRDWSKDPSKPAIIIGTVDLIGSALLFSAYRSSFKRRPLEAGLLGQDSLLILDEAHLSKPFEKLVTSIGAFQKHQGTAMKVIRMSATTAGDDSARFKLEDSDLSDRIIEERYVASKALKIERPVETKKLNDSLANAAIGCAKNGSLAGKRIVVFVRTPDDATAIAELIRKHEATKTQPGRYADAVEVLTGTMRGLERDELVEKLVFKERWLNGDLKPDDHANQHPVFLISTSAGEVGFDLNADHMVGDAAPLESMIQRLGRVNRRGRGKATIQLFVETPKKDKNGEPKKLEGVDLSIDYTIKLLQDVKDVSPKNLAHLKQTSWNNIPESEQKKANPKSLYELACSPEPTMVELTDILLDAWSMTSINEPMPGRPEVAPWLRGIADDLPQTTIAWRAELDLPGFDQLDLEEIEEWFDTYRILAHETLSVRTSVAADWFVNRWNKLTNEQQRTVGPRGLIVDRAGLKRMTLKELVDQLSRKGGDKTAAIRNADLILPASFGGIERRSGLLDADAPVVPKEEDKRPYDEQCSAQAQRLLAPDVADERGRCREVVATSDDGETERRPLVAGTKPASYSRFTLTLESDDDRTVRLISYVPRSERSETGQKRQTLAGHAFDVRRRADAFIKALVLGPNDPVRRALELAADWHDRGKDRERWQRSVGRKHGEPPLAKSGDDMKRDPRGYRHEFGSLREFIDEHQGKIDPEVFDLGLHLIASHHGRGRPHFPQGGFDPDSESRSDEIHTDAIRRFARLQRKYGHWYLAWLENLLRCADALASADPVTGILAEADGGDQ